MKHAGIEFAEKRIALFTGTYQDDLRPYRSDHRVPVLLDGDFQVWDSIAILEYLAEKFPSATGWPADSHARAIARSVSAEMHSSFAALRRAMPMNCRKHFPNFEISREVQTDINRVVTLWEQCRTEYGQGGGWLFGDYSIADAMYAPVVMRLNGYDVSLTGIAHEYVQTTLTDPHLQDWIEAGKQEKEIIEQDEA